jgi:NaMN:DMB phosphoribosyltransferase
MPSSSNPKRLDECSAKRTSRGHCKPTGHIGRTQAVANAGCAIERRSHQPERTRATPGRDMPAQVNTGVGTLLIAPS